MKRSSLVILKIMKRKPDLGEEDVSEEEASDSGSDATEQVVGLVKTRYPNLTRN